jgi:hypothetical protein
MAKFDYFNHLPEELRVQIWDMAIRNDSPAVHFLSMYEVMGDEKSVVDPAKKVHAVRGEEFEITSFWTGLAAPWSPGEGKLSWTNGNISTYLEDSGLWTACKESRKRTWRHFKPDNTSLLVSRLGRIGSEVIRAICNQASSSVNMGFTRDNGERQYLTVRPTSDLICLQLPEISTKSREMGFDWSDVNLFPSFRWYPDESGSHCYQYWSSTIRNVAVEYDPA